MNDLKKQDLIEEANAILAETELFIADHVYTNYEPHPYMIGPGHVVHASEKFCGILSTDAIENYETKTGRGCAWKGCNLRYSDHKVSHFLMVKLMRDMENQEASEVLYTLKPLLKREHLEGIGFLNMNKEFKIAPQKQPE